MSLRKQCRCTGPSSGPYMISARPVLLACNDCGRAWEDEPDDGGRYEAADHQFTEAYEES